MKILLPFVFLLASCASAPPLTTPPSIFKEVVEKNRSIPELGKPSSAVIGSNMYEDFRYTESTLYKVTLLGDAKGIMDFNAKPELPSGFQHHLFKTSSDSLNAICPDEAIRAAVPGSFKFCLVDTKNNGEFDSSMFTQRLKYFPLDKPVKYKIEKNDGVPLTASNDRRLKIHVIYQGVNKGSIKISFREFYDGVARPAFTQDISYDLIPGGETIVAFKGMRLKVISADNEKIKYVVLNYFD